MSKNQDRLPSSTKVVPRPPTTISIVRIPHGFFHGGVTQATIAPPITTSSYEWNNFILTEYNS